MVNVNKALDKMRLTPAWSSGKGIFLRPILNQLFGFNPHIWSQPRRSTSSLRPNNNTGMNYFVIGVSGVTCGGKTTLTKLLQRSFPWCRIIHQDNYFYDDDHPSHIRVPEVENHVNYEVMGSMDMTKMYKDVKTLLSNPVEDDESGNIPLDKATKPDAEDIPNFDSGFELLNSVGTLDFDTSKFRHIPVLIIEGFIIFESQLLYDLCDVRFFVTLDESECRNRRSTRNYNPPDCPGYFDKIVWPEYAKHLDRYVAKRPGIKVFDGKTPIKNIWQDSVQIVECRLAEKYATASVNQSESKIP